MEVFSRHKPKDNSCSNPVDQVDRHQYGSPAGGYWSNTESMNNFGKWLCKEWQNPEFQELTQKYGSEFCWKDKNGTNKIGHSGGMQSISSNFNVDLDEEVIMTSLSNRPAGSAFHFNKGIMNQFEKLKEDRNMDSAEEKSDYKKVPQESTETFVEKLNLQQGAKKKEDSWALQTQNKGQKDVTEKHTKPRSFAEAVKAGIAVSKSETREL